MTHSFIFFFNDTATTEIYTLSLHDALPISRRCRARSRLRGRRAPGRGTALRVFPRGERRARRSSAPGSAPRAPRGLGDRKSTRLNSSHLVISYAVFCLKKKKSRHRWVNRRD